MRLVLLEEVEDGLLERDAVVGVGVVGGHVYLVDLLIAGFVEGFDKGVVCGGEAIVGGENEDVTSGEFGSEVHEVKCGGVGDDLVGETLGAGAGERGHAFVGEVGGDGFDGSIVLVGGERLQAAGVEVGCGDGGDGFDGGVVCAALDGHEASHAVTDEDDVGGIDAELFGVGGIAQIDDGGVDVFNAVGEGEVAG